MFSQEEIRRLHVRVAELEEENEKLKSENIQLKKWIENRKTIEKAKGVLMSRYRWTEDTTFKKMQQYSMRFRVPMIELARSVLNGEQIDLT